MVLYHTQLAHVMAGKATDSNTVPHTTTDKQQRHWTDNRSSVMPEHETGLGIQSDVVITCSTLCNRQRDRTVAWAFPHLGVGVHTLISFNACVPKQLHWTIA